MPTPLDYKKLIQKRKRLVVATVLLVVVIAVVLSLIYLMRSELVFLSDGRVIEAQKVIVVQDSTFCEIDGEVHRFRSEDISGHVDAFSISPAHLKLRFVYYVDLIGGVGSDVLANMSSLFSERFAGLPGIIVWGLAILAVAAAFLILLRLHRRITGGSPAEQIVQAEGKGAHLSGPRLVNLEDVVRLFLKIYQMQMKAPPEVPARFERLETTPQNFGVRYRLGIKMDGEWKWRNMTLRPIGQGTASKSQCFYVIYDTHMVIKVPPVPIRDFQDYIRWIQFEASIVHALVPRKCIIPNVSVIMNKVHQFDDTYQRSPEQMENHYVRFLKNSPELHWCLQINGDFVFFTDLSQDYFLEHVLAGLGNRYGKTVLAQETQLITDYSGFVARYGSDQARIYFDLQKLYTSFTDGLGKIQRNLGLREALRDEQKREWFHTRLCDPSAPLRGRSKSFLKAVSDLLDRLFHEKQETVIAYRNLVNQYVREVSFAQHRPIKESLLTNLMDLLGWLEQSQVALRDLKPEHLLVSGDPIRYPAFLTNPEEFSIGLIDLETAVICPQANQEPWVQPQLAGTPAYGTPSHLVHNEVLEKCYPELSRVFLLQDWYAVIGIIFLVVTGRQLFEETAKEFPGIIQNLRQAEMGGNRSKRSTDPAITVSGKWPRRSFSKRPPCIAVSWRESLPTSQLPSSMSFRHF